MLGTSTSRCDDPLRERGCPGESRCMSTAPHASVHAVVTTRCSYRAAVRAASRDYSDADSKTLRRFNAALKPSRRSVARVCCAEFSEA